MISKVVFIVILLFIEVRAKPLKTCNDPKGTIVEIKNTKLDNVEEMIVCRNKNFQTKLVKIYGQKCINIFPENKINPTFNKHRYCLAEEILNSGKRKKVVIFKHERTKNNKMGDIVRGQKHYRNENDHHGSSKVFMIISWILSLISNTSSIHKAALANWMNHPTFQ